MQITDDPDWHDQVILTSTAVGSGERNLLARAAGAGRLTRIVRGAYIDGEAAARRSADDRYRDRIHARQLVSARPLLFSHDSAASLWRIPRVSAWPARVHVLDARPHRGSPGVFHHVGMPEPIPDSIDGVLVTSLTRTLIDLARTASTADALVAMDAGLAGIHFGGRTLVAGRSEILSELDGVGSARGTRAARFVVDFADPNSGSPGETISRLSMARARLAVPVLQHPFSDAHGMMVVDFWWPESGVIGEFDGAGKYLRSEGMGGRTAAEVVIDEKNREDRLRRQVSRVVRWGWDVARSPAQLGALLRAAGVP